MRRLLLFVAVILAGASGVGLEVLLLSSAGLALGYGRSSAVGLAVFLAGWAVGAYGSGRWRGSAAWALLVLGAILCVVADPALRILLYVGGDVPGGAAAQITAVVMIALVALLQGAFLPLFARSLERVSPKKQDLSLLLACSFAGSVLGAYGIGHAAIAQFGRTGAAALGGVVALAAGIIAAVAARNDDGIGRLGAIDLDAEHRDAELGFARAGIIVGLTTAWLAGLEWIGLRLGVLWLSGMQPALTAVVCASLLALAFGAFVLPRLVPFTERGVVATLCVCAAGAAWPVLAAPAMRLLGTIAQAWNSSKDPDPRGWQTTLDQLPELLRALVLVGPSLCALGAVIPVLHRVLRRTSGTSGELLGRLYLHEAWGASIGVPLVHFVLVPNFGLAGATGGLMLVGALALCATYTVSPRASTGAIVAVAVLAAWTASRRDPALDAPPLANPAFTLRSFRNDRDFAVAVVDDGMAGERTLLTDGFRAAGTGKEYRYMSLLGHLPILLHERPRNVAVLALGTGTTLGAVALHPEVERIDVLEISPAVVDAAPWFELKNRGVLQDSAHARGTAEESSQRVRVRLGDGRYTLAQHPGEYDVITMEPLLPDSPFAVYLYTREFYSRARRALAPGGLVCQWVPPHALAPRSFAAVLDAFRSSFQWSSVWLFGTQVILLGGEREPELAPDRFAGLDSDLASALRELGIATPSGLAARLVSFSDANPTSSAPSDGERVSDSGRAPPTTSTSDASVAEIRPLTDEDPWIAYTTRRRGAVLLGDLPENLRWLRMRESDPPRSWVAATGVDGARIRRGVRAIHAAREAHAREEALLRGAPTLSLPSDSTLATALAQARLLCDTDPELAELEREITFLGALRRGIATLSADRSRAGAEAALPDLLQATELERERADVHLYMATVLSRLASPAATKAMEAALTRCPRAAETAEGRRAHDLGLSDDLWQRALIADQAAALAIP